MLRKQRLARRRSELVEKPDAGKDQQLKKGGRDRLHFK